jgi:N-acetylmuramoyl-L-alanine amidase
MTLDTSKKTKNQLSADQPKEPSQIIWKGKGVYIDIGHGAKPGAYDPGAVHDASKVTEHGLNQIAAAACAQELRQAGVPVTVNDARVSNYQAGAACAHYDVFVSVHHNSIMGKNVQGSEAIFHAGKGTAADRQLANLAAKAMADSLGIKNRGAKGGGVAVLSGARGGNVRAAILAELYFMHHQSPANPPPSQFKEWSERGGRALANAILDWLKAAA